MKDQRFKTYVYWGVTAVAVIAVGVAILFLFLNMNRVRGFFNLLTNILMPIIYGAVLAYLLTPIYNKSVSWGVKWFSKIINPVKAVDRLARILATTISLVLIFAVVTGLSSMLLPELSKSIQGIVDALPTNVDNFSKWLQQVLADNAGYEQWIMPLYEQGTAMLEGWVATDLMPNLDKIITGVSRFGMSIITLLKNILIGLIVMVYLLNIKDTFSAQGKKIIYGAFPLKAANYTIGKIRFIHRVFGGFIIGKLLDSLIIGIICFVCLSVMKMPYVLLVSVIVGVTNIIPFFGPFIGAIPSAILILLVSPIKCLWFLGFILLLQQFDGNILGPKILGDSTGLSSFWVLFSILLFGGLFGFVGMIIGVPTFAVIYDLISEWLSRSLRKKKLSVRTTDYLKLDYIDEEEKAFIDMEDMN